MSTLNENNESSQQLNNLSQNNNDLLGIDEMITNNANDIMINFSSNNENNSNDKKYNKSNEDEPLTKKSFSTEVIQIPSIENNNISNENTLNESIITTICRDFYLIYTKLKFVIMPYAEKEQKSFHIKQWDLWGPLILDMLLACTLAINSKEKSNMIILIFVIFWFGGLILYLNAYFLGVKSSIFQMFCLLGYCLFPLNLSAIFVVIFNIRGILRLIFVTLTTLWSIYSSSDFLKNITNQDQRYLVLYPCILFYLYISWFIISINN